MMGAVESQKADGVLHIHLFLYLQMIMQFSTLHELARVLRDGMLSAEAMKHFVSYVRCASYPDVEAYREGRGKVEESWPAYADDASLSRLPPFFQAGTCCFGRRVAASVSIQTAARPHADEPSYPPAANSGRRSEHRREAVLAI